MLMAFLVALFAGSDEVREVCNVREAHATVGSRANLCHCLYVQLFKQ